MLLLCCCGTELQQANKLWRGAALLEGQQVSSAQPADLLQQGRAAPRSSFFEMLLLCWHHA